MATDNPVTRHFFGIWHEEALEQTETSRILAVRMADSYAFIGVTERMEESVIAITRLFPSNRAYHMPSNIDRNASKGSAPIADEDRHYLEQHNQLDFAIYRHANQRLDRILADESTANLACDEFKRRISLR